MFWLGTGTLAMVLAVLAVALYFAVDALLKRALVWLPDTHSSSD